MNRLFICPRLLQFLAVAFTAGSMSTVLAEAGGGKSVRPNILWIVCEDISPFLGAYGNNELKTPNLDQLARGGVRFTRAYTAAGVCAPSRSAIITGMYPTSIGTHNMRTLGDPKSMPVDIPRYSAVLPEYVKAFPEYLRLAGYYTTNNQQTDYQFEPPVTVWDENGPAASYRNRPEGKPFLSVFNFGVTHESMLWGRKDPLRVDPSKVTVPPIYPDTQVVREGIARLFTNIEIMDGQVGELLKNLKDDGVYDNTFIFFYSDHGGSLPWMKREILERGTHVPLIIRFPRGEHAGETNDDLVSGVDFAPTVLSLSGVPIPTYMQGQAFLGEQKSPEGRKYVFAARDRMDSEYDRVRMVRDKRYRYVFNYEPEKPHYQNVRYRLSIPMMNEILKLRDEGKLAPAQQAWFETKDKEELYDVEDDPWELHSLAKDPNFADKLTELRGAFQEWTKRVGDTGAIPEKELIKNMWNGEDKPPTTAQPEVLNEAGGVRILCATKGASIGYWIAGKGETPQPATHVFQSWDFGGISGKSKNGQPQPAPQIWRVYDGSQIKLALGDELHVNAMRIGYRASTLTFVAKN